MQYDAGMPDPRVLLKRDESYGVHVMVNVSQSPGVSTAQLADWLSLPPAYTAKVVRKLVNAGFLTSRTGRKGGLDLARDVRHVTLLDVIEGISGKLILDDCQAKPRCATQARSGHCNLKMAWLATTLQIRDVLSEVTVAQLVDPASRAEAPAG